MSFRDFSLKQAGGVESPVAETRQTRGPQVKLRGLQGKQEPAGSAASTSAEDYFATFSGQEKEF